MMRSRRVLFAAALLGIACVLTARPASAGLTVTGAGSTWSQIAVDQWRADAKSTGVLGSNSVNYQGVGSSAGRSFYIQDQVDFAVSEIPFEPSEVDALKQKNKSYTYLPIVAGGTSLMYNLKDAAGKPVRDLRLSSATIAKVFTKKITNWNDPAITADNDGRVLPSRDIVPVVRSDGSGTTAQFTTYLLKRENATWCAFATSHGLNPCTYTSNYPQANGFVYQSGSDGVANYVHSEGTGLGAVTYVETGYALQRGRPVAAVKNVAGKYTLPTSKNVSIALTKAELNADRTQRLDNVYTNPDPNTYPISSYSYMIAPTKGFGSDKGNVLGKFMIYFACTGQRKADQLGYSPLPPNLVKVVFSAVKMVPGAPKPPPIEKCDNPTIQGGAGSVGDSTGDDLGDGGSDGVIGGGPGGSDPGGSPRSSSSGGSAAGGGQAATRGVAGSSQSGDSTGLVAADGTAGPGAGYVGVSGGVSDQALPEIDLTTEPPSWLPLAFAGSIVLLVVLVPPAFAISGRRRDERSRREA